MHRALATPSHPRLQVIMGHRGTGRIHADSKHPSQAVPACVSVVNLELEAQLPCSDAYIHVGSVNDFGQRPATINSMEPHDIYSTLLKVKPVRKTSQGLFVHVRMPHTQADRFLT